MKRLFLVAATLIASSAAAYHTPEHTAGRTPERDLGHSRFFKQRKVTLVNKSGGIATVLSNRNIGNLYNRQQIQPNAEMDIIVKDIVASARFNVGPEDLKTDIKVDFCNCEPGAQLTLESKGFKASGFSTKCNPFSVLVVNNSGGNARVVKDFETSFNKNQKIADHNQVKATVRPGAWTAIEAGPENNKKCTKIMFGAKTGNNPTITLNQGGWMSKAVSARDLYIQTKRCPAFRTLKTQPEAATEQKRMTRTSAQMVSKKQSMRPQQQAM